MRSIAEDVADLLARGYGHIPALQAVDRELPPDVRLTEDELIALAEDIAALVGGEWDAAYWRQLVIYAWPHRLKPVMQIPPPLPGEPFLLRAQDRLVDKVLMCVAIGSGVLLMADMLFLRGR